jgi:hypothetical protein
LSEADQIYIENKSDPLFMLWLSLYCGEGDKTRGLSISNSDPGILLKWINWHKKYTRSNIVPTIFGHEDVNFEESKQYWSNILKLEKDIHCRSLFLLEIKDQEEYCHMALLDLRHQLDQPRCL